MYYNYKNLHKYEYNKNFFYEDYEKAFSNIFKPLVPIEANAENRMFNENNIDNIKNRYNKILKEPENVKMFNFKFEKFTILQKIISLWGLVNYGFSFENILAEIPNIFSFSKSIAYDNDKIGTYLNKTLEELKIDKYLICFENIKFSNYETLNNFTCKNFALPKTQNGILNLNCIIHNTAQAN